MKFSKYKNKPSHEDDLDEKIDRFNKKAYWDYLIQRCCFLYFDVFL
ncbi:hypothetical protein HYQ50_2100 [Lactobacillus crispatus]|nr:hypothetical protein HMPREF9250_00836 [Lactobacillus crispatus FB049-03]MBI1701806.1 hypothetical protein [Lactobacillus crispatus]MBI1711084.1 hypothetical protein [Lactobacillus crispatus]